MMWISKVGNTWFLVPVKQNCHLAQMQLMSVCMCTIKMLFLTLVVPLYMDCSLSLTEQVSSYVKGSVTLWLTPLVII